MHDRLWSGRCCHLLVDGNNKVTWFVNYMTLLNQRITAELVAPSLGYKIVPEQEDWRYPPDTTGQVNLVLVGEIFSEFSCVYVLINTNGFQWKLFLLIQRIRTLAARI